MMSLAYKYTDTDVRRDPDLIGRAYAFLRAYPGDFEFLIDSRNDLNRWGALPTGVVRGVLNCMRAQPNANELLGFSTRPVSVIHPERRRPASVMLKTTWNMTYFMSTWQNAYLAHLLDKKRSTLLWMPHVGEFRCHAYPVCGTRLSLGIMTNDPRGREVCKRCLMENV